MKVTAYAMAMVQGRRIALTPAVSGYMAGVDETGAVYAVPLEEEIEPAEHPDDWQRLFGQTMREAYGEMPVFVPLHEVRHEVRTIAAIRDVDEAELKVQAFSDRMFRADHVIRLINEMQRRGYALDEIEANDEVLWEPTYPEAPANVVREVETFTLAFRRKDGGIDADRPTLVAGLFDYGEKPCEVLVDFTHEVVSSAWATVCRKRVDDVEEDHAD